MLAELREGIHWVGYVDWNVRDFHGYRTERGSTYNAYLVRDEQTALIDTVKGVHVRRLLANVAQLAAPEQVRYLVCNHAEPDHAGGFSEVVRAFPQAEVVCNARCREVLSRYHDTSGWKFRIIAEGQSLRLGRRSLHFVETPMAHWPESMATFVPEEKLLFSMDAFGQHLASSGRFDDEEPLEVILAEAKTYYANILMPYGTAVAKALDKAGGLQPEMIAPSHGVIWRSHVGKIISAYEEWIACRARAKVLVIYDTMWKSTEQMAQAIVDGAAGQGVDARLIHIRSSNETVIATEVLDAAAVAFGSATLNRTMMPQVGAILTYLKGLRPIGKAGFVFGSCGWMKGATKDMQSLLEEMNFEILREPLTCRYAPDEAALAECRQAGELLARRAAEVAAEAPRP